MVVEKVETAIRYIKEYLGNLAYQGHNVIHTVPIFTADSNSAYGLTSVAIQTVAKSPITMENCGHIRKSTDAPVVLILGTCGAKPLVLVPPKWNAGMAISGKGQGSLGTISLSKANFLEGVLLKRLAGINALTTIVPNFAGVIDGEWNFELTSWAKHMFRKNRECHWSFKGHSDGALHYLWEHYDGWNHHHENSHTNEKNGQYSIDCRTRNNLSIPTVYRPGVLQITLTGSSYLKITGQNVKETWRYVIS